MHTESGTSIHETAIISSEAIIGEGVRIGPYAVIGPDCDIGPGTVIGPHVVMEGRIRVGARARISQFASLGAPPQDLKYAGEPTSVEIGDDTIIREFVTVHRGTAGGVGTTRVGKNCLLMAYCHIAHDCQVGDFAILANGVTLGGHVVLGEQVVIGGLSAVHQFCHVGPYAFLGGMSGVNKDIPPYTKYWGARGKLYGLNLVGLRRHGFPKSSVDALREAYRVLFQAEGTRTEAVEKVSVRFADVPEVQGLCGFLRASKRGVPAGAGGDQEI